MKNHFIPLSISIINLNKSGTHANKKYHKNNPTIQQTIIPHMRFCNLSDLKLLIIFPIFTIRKENKYIPPMNIGKKIITCESSQK